MIGHDEERFSRGTAKAVIASTVSLDDDESTGTGSCVATLYGLDKTTVLGSPVTCVWNPTTKRYVGALAPSLWASIALSKVDQIATMGYYKVVVTEGGFTHTFHYNAFFCEDS